MGTFYGRIFLIRNKLLESGPAGLMTLIKAIKKSSKTQEFIAQKLERRYADLRNNEENKSNCAYLRILVKNIEQQ